MSKLSNRFQVIRRNDEELLLRRILIAVLVLISTAVVSFKGGEQWSSYLRDENGRLEEVNKSLSDELELAKAETARARLKVKTSNIAVNAVREENANLTEEITQLSRDIEHYKRLMSPIKNDKGLRVDSLSLEPSSDPGRFRLALVLTQLGLKNRTVIKGGVTITLLGSENGERKDYSLQSLKVTDQDLALKFRFKYFQEVEEEFVLPKGFVPEQVQVKLQSTGKKAMSVEKLFDWLSLAPANEDE